MIEGPRTTPGECSGGFSQRFARRLSPNIAADRLVAATVQIPLAWRLSLTTPMLSFDGPRYTSFLPITIRHTLDQAAPGCPAANRSVLLT